MRSLHPRRRPRTPRPARRGGFTLIEATLATVIVATGVLALIEAQEAYLRKNDFAVRQGTAFLLANEIRELTANMPLLDPQAPKEPAGINVGEDPDDPSTFDDLDDFVDGYNGATSGPRTYSIRSGYAGPINALGLAEPTLRRYEQVVTVNRVSLSNMRSARFFDEPGYDSDGNLEFPRLPEVYRVTVDVNFIPNPDAAEPDVQPLTSVTWTATQSGDLD